MLNIEERSNRKYAFAELGFRPFFTLALISAAVLILIWMGAYFSGWTPPAIGFSSMVWHAHEMVFGYGMAVATGFLLTAEKNWTGIQTLQGRNLMALALLWLLARLLPLVLPQPGMWLVALCDLAFNGWFLWAISQPLMVTRQWEHSAFPGKMLLMLLSNIVFYLGALGFWAEGVHYGVYAGFYIILALIFTMGRRVIPFFIEKGVDCPFKAKNWKWLDISSLFLFLAFMISDLVAPVSQATALLAAVLFAMHCLRLWGWYTPGLWTKPLLWVLYVGYAWIVLGFLLKALSVWVGISPFLAIHSFAYGGIGMITLGMISRVSLGHTGRSVFDPPKFLSAVFAVVAAGTVIRVIFPMLLPSGYSSWILLSQFMWIFAFAAVAFVYTPMLAKARVDGRPG